MLVRVTAPSPIITAAEARARLRIDDASEDAELEALIAAATQWIDGADGWLGRALGPQAWDLRVDGWPFHSRWYGPLRVGCGFRLPLPPLISVTSVSYKDTAGQTQTFDASNYEFSGVGGFGLLSLKSGASWPAMYTGPEALTIRFQAGYADGVPEPIRQAVFLLVGHFYENRLPIGQAGQGGSLPFSVDALLAPYRVYA